MDMQRAKLATAHGIHPEQTSFYNQLQAITREAALDLYTVTAFRHLHYLSDPNHSTSGLAIDDDLLLDIIWHGAYTIEDLEEKLMRGQINSDNLCRGGNDKQKLKILQVALVAWHRSTN
jgi:hypothetical protein